VKKAVLKKQIIFLLTIADQTEIICEDVRRIKDHPLVPTNIPVYGYIFDVKSGKLIEIPEATKLGKTAKLKKKPVCFLKF
jgi:carbonic anhydrase